ncbi:AAA family ATPase [Candidatus Poriferisocius sp.]|uniref:AAA family ATPase n=1 Tax=Candidatus Poriferisocius sp. TaxID=3101276 RepID=UPI003B0250CB
MGARGISLPRPVWARIRSFSLYDHAQEIRADFGTGVFCLAGANGLGKSTFLAAVGFAVTGVVAEPGRAFNSADEYLKNCRSYSASAFEGRISEEDRETAEVELLMLAGGAEYRIVRNMFEPMALRALEVKRGDPETVTAFDKGSDEERHEQYEEMILQDVGVSSFSQLVMLHHLVQTFDERRHLLFWDDKVSQAALFLAFGLDPDDSKKADNLRRQAERADSRARNHQFAATTAEKNLADLTERLESLADGETDANEKLLALQEQEDEASKRVKAASARHQDAELHRAEVAAELRSIRAAYEQAYDRAMFGRRDPKVHPVVQSILDASQCPVCGCAEEDVAAHVVASLQGGICPVCIKPIAAADGSSEALSQLDASMQALAQELEHADQKVQRLLAELEAEQDSLNAIRDGLRENEDDVAAAMALESEPGESLEQVIQSYQRDIEDRMRRKKDERRKRDAYRSDLRTLQNSLAVSYQEAESEFVPKFTDLAREFLGLDLALNFEISVDVSRLVLSVDGAPRRGSINLSESQRFFVDIALRMALTRQLSADDSLPVLYVDTPEGSLDIAYERRAGSMFGQFVEEGGQLLMTANINTSELLLNLARTCTSSHMRLQRMTEWATLSDVQVNERDAFDQAFHQIEERLNEPR